jgi:hypothetical protein
MIFIQFTTPDSIGDARATARVVHHKGKVVLSLSDNDFDSAAVVMTREETLALVEALKVSVSVAADTQPTA